jgi:hypothetical protein
MVEHLNFNRKFASLKTLKTVFIFCTLLKYKFEKKILLILSQNYKKLCTNLTSVHEVVLKVHIHKRCGSGIFDERCNFNIKIQIFSNCHHNWQR